jgi:hypothetical protein
MKLFVGCFVGGIILFILQFFSWAAINFHRPAQQYTSSQDSILNYLSSKFDSSGGYLLPTTPDGASSDEMKAVAEQSMGKPWAQIYYHKSQDANMGVNMLKNLVTNILMVLFFCWIVAGFTYNSFAKTLLAAIFTGIIIFLHGSYTEHIWYPKFDMTAHFFDFVGGWALCGIWLGWWLNRKKAQAA